MRGLRPFAESSTNRLSASVASAVDADLAQCLLARGVGRDGEHPGHHGPLGAAGVDIDDDEGDARVLQFAGGAAPDASETADDVMILELVDHAFGPPFADHVA